MRKKGLMGTAYSYKKTSIIAYRIGDVGTSPLYVHPECVDKDFPGEGEPVFAQDIVLGEDGCVYFPGECHNEWEDRSVHTTCCGGCGQWFDEGGSLDIDGLENAVKQWLRFARSKHHKIH